MVVGLLGGAVLAYIKRCEWLKICGSDPLQDLTQQITGAVSSVSSDITDLAKQQLADNQDEHKVAAAITASGDAKRISDAIKVSQTPLISKSSTVKPVSSSTVVPLSAPTKNSLLSDSCHFSAACHALVRIWRGPGKDPCVACGSSAYARSNLAALTLYGGRMSYN